MSKKRLQPTIKVLGTTEATARRTSKLIATANHFNRSFMTICFLTIHSSSRCELRISYTFLCIALRKRQKTRDKERRDSGARYGKKNHKK